MADLEIPKAALPAFRDLLAPQYAAAGEATLRDDLAMVAAPVVAQYLRELTTLRAFRNVQDELRRRANDLDGGGAQ